MCKNTEERRKYFKKYKSDNKKRLAAYHKQYNTDNKERLVEYNREYRRANKDKVSKWNSDARMRHKKAGLCGNCGRVLDPEIDRNNSTCGVCIEASMACQAMNSGSIL